MDWDELAQEMCQKLIRDLEALRERHPDLARVFLPDGVGSGANAIAHGPGELSRQIGAVAPWRFRPGGLQDYFEL